MVNFADDLLINSKKIKRNMCIRNVKIYIMIVFVILLVIYIILVIACGGFGLENCV